MTSIQEVTQVRVTHVWQSRPGKTFNDSHPLNAFPKQLILNAWKGSACQRHFQVSKKDPRNMVNSSNVWYPPVNPCDVCNPSVVTTHWRTNTLRLQKVSSQIISERALNTPPGWLDYIQMDQLDLVLGIMSQKSVFVYVSASAFGN